MRITEKDLKGLVHKDMAEIRDLMFEASQQRYQKGCCPKEGDQCEWHQRLWDITHE